LIYSFVIDHTDVEEVKANTKEVFANLFISRLPSTEEEVGYEIKDDTIIMKYEQNEDGRIMLDSMRKLKEIEAFLPPIFGAVLEMHQIKKLKICERLYDVDVFVNQPTGMYINERADDGQVVRHEVGGVIYERSGNIIRQVEDLQALTKMAEMRKLNDKFIYVPVGYCFHDPLVSKALCPRVTVSQWAEKTVEVNTFFDTINQF
jgi:hypothetical protein